MSRTESGRRLTAGSPSAEDPVEDVDSEKEPLVAPAATPGAAAGSISSVIPRKRDSDERSDVKTSRGVAAFRRGGSSPSLPCVAAPRDVAESSDVELDSCRRDLGACKNDDRHRGGVGVAGGDAGGDGADAAQKPPVSTVPGMTRPISSSPDILRSYTCDAIKNLSDATATPEVDRRHLLSLDSDGTWIRRLSSGDAPYWLAEEGASDLRTKTLIVPGTGPGGCKEDSYLIGRASKRRDFSAVLRMTRMTEVAPTNSSLVDADEEQWKMPIHLFTAKKQGSQIKRRASKRVRSYYKAQDQLITAYENISLKVADEMLDTNVIKKQRKLAAKFSKITLAINLMLMIGKLVASVLSGSMSIISSLVDSVVDLLSGLIMWWATRAVRNRDPYAYPQGRTKLEPVSIIILSVVMALASLQLVRESVEKIVHLTDGMSSLPRMEVPTFIIAGSTVVIKFVLWVVCRKINSPIVQALAMDHRNDVLSNSVAIVCGYLGSIEFQDQFDVQGFIYVDPAGAILISLYIVFNWWQTGSEQIKMLTGHTARPDFLSKLTWTAMNHDENIRHIDTVRAFHFGSNFLVEMDIVLPGDMVLRVAHDIGESLQQKLENIPEVERAFVHLDYEFSHNPNSEHKVV